MSRGVVMIGKRIKRALWSSARAGVGYARRNSSVLMAAVLVALVLFVPGLAHAQTPSPAPSSFANYGALATSAQTETQTAAAAIAPVVMLVVAGLACIGLAVKWMKRSAKSS